MSLAPDIAAKSKWARIETLLRNRSFQEKHGDAIKRYLAGITKVACETADAPASPGIAGLLPAPA